MNQRQVCQSFEKAPHLLGAGTSRVSPFNGKIQGDLLALDDIIVLHEMDAYSKYTLVVQARPKNPLEGLGRLFGFSDCSFRRGEDTSDG